ncbi:MAG: type VI secretion system tip protein VgrG [Proteobacteria bacterium]|nr:type VI secretion system tip protein VgrG [Pseudomonadota bacterium]
MSLTEQVKFTFTSSAVDADTFSVLSFEGAEGLSRWYRFDILLVSHVPDLDLNEILLSPAVFTIHREGDDAEFHGVLAAMVQEHAFDGFYFYRAVLAPRLWWLTLTHHNQIFLNRSVPQIVEAVLNESGLLSGDYEFRFEQEYDPIEYVCQYRETHFDFISHWMERCGMYYFFEQTPDGEKLIITDTHLSHKPTPRKPSLQYSQPSGLDHDRWQEIVTAISCNQRVVPRKVMVKDYNYRRPSLDLTGQADVSPQQGHGRAFIYGDHFRTPEEGDRLAKIRAEGYLCREKVFAGSSSFPYLNPGYIFNLESHFRSDYNQAYLVMNVTHQGVQGGYMVSGLRKELSEAEQQLRYSNTFSACPASVQFRPEHVTPKSRFYGVINAKIDAAESGQYAELDGQGRYKVVMPFDTSGRKDGKASTWLRMAQPYAGSSHGMHFPLHKETEVLVTFIDGDPDRPIITGAVPNPETASVVTNENQTMAQIVSAGQNRIHMNDEQGRERILLHTPGANSFLRMGAPNDPPRNSPGGSDNDSSDDKDDDKDEKKSDWGWDPKGTKRKDAEKHWKEDGVLLSTGGPASFEIGKFKFEGVAGVVIEVFVGGEVSQKFAFTYDGYIGGQAEIIHPFRMTWANTIFQTALADVTKRVNVLVENDDHIALDGQTTSIGQELIRLTGSIDTVTDTADTLTQSNQDMNDTLNQLNRNANSLNDTVTDVYKTRINDVITEVKKIGTSLKKVTVSKVNANTVTQTVGTNLETTQNSIKELGTSIHNSNLTLIN